MSNKILSSIVLLLLAGCKSEQPQMSDDIMPPLAGDAFEVLLKEGTQTTVSLKNIVIDPQGLPVTLESVVPIDQKCDTPTSIDQRALTFTVDNIEPELCSYRYSVKNHPAQASSSKTSEASSYVLKGVSDGSQLPPLSETTQVSTPITISITPIEGYTLDNDVVVLGDGRAVVDSIANTITYTPDAQGVTRLLYTMSNGERTDMLAGTVDIAVSDEGNTAPNALPVELATQPDGSGYYNINQPYTIDLSRYVSDADGDAVQLVQVKAWNANVALSAPDDPTNLSLTFQTDKPGEHYVTYVVSDHRGGYAVEQIYIVTYDLSSVATWEYIQKGTKIFSAPLTQSEALVAGVSFSDTYVDTNGSTIATFTFGQAEKLCESKGRLPTPTQLKELVSFEGGPEKKGWPVDLAYWADDGGVPTLVDLKTGESQAESKTEYNVTCFNEGGFAIDADTSDFEAVANRVDKAIITVKLTLNGTPVEGQFVEASSDDTNVTFDASNGITDTNGLVSFALSSFVARKVPVVVTYNGETLEQTVTFVADEDTATIYLDVITDNATYDDMNGNRVEATMVDINANPLSERKIIFDSPDTVTITDLSTATDALGKQDAKVVWGDSDIPLFDETVNVSARFTPSSGGPEVSATTEMTFTVPGVKICGGTVNNADDNAMGNCLKVATDALGNWYTSTPSSTVMDFLGYTTHNSATNKDDTYSGLESSFAQFRQDGGDGGQFSRWCKKLNTLKFGGRTDWRSPTLSELENLFGQQGNLSNLNWPTRSSYWSSSKTGSKYYNVDLTNNNSHADEVTKSYYASCISESDVIVPKIGMCGTGINDSDKENATGECLKVASDPDGRWYTSSPSIPAMKKLGYRQHNTSKNTGDTYASYNWEYGKEGPDGGVFATFRQDGEGDGQFDRYCKKLGTLEFAGKKDWRRPTVDELIELARLREDMWIGYGWPTVVPYYTQTYRGKYLEVIHLGNGSPGPYDSVTPTAPFYASCVSGP